MTLRVGQQLQIAEFEVCTWVELQVVPAEFQQPLRYRLVQQVVSVMNLQSEVG
jgi:hypothetical protein